MNSESKVADRVLSPQPNAVAPRRALRIAVVGCGAIAEQMHLPVLAGYPNVTIAALVDRDLQRARRLAQGYGVGHAFADTAELTADMIDAAIVATPAYHHAPCTIELAGRGIHVLVEKPMATTLDDAEAMIEAVEKAGVVLSVGFFRHLYPSLRLMRALVDSGWAGAPKSFLVEGGGMYNWGAATLANMKRDLAGGGVLIDYGSHMVDLLLGLFDGPAEVLEYRDNALGGVEADCSIRARLQDVAGAPVEGQIELARTRELENMVRLECERATLEFQVNERFRLRVIPRGVELIDPFSRQTNDFWFDAAWQQEPCDESWYATFARQFDDWVSAIQTGSEPILSGRSALRTVRFIEDCYKQPKNMSERWVWHGVSEENAPAELPARSIPWRHPGGRGGPILVTGASGFIGCRVAEILRLRERLDVRAVVHNPGNASRLARLDVELVQADLANEEDVRRIVKDCDAVVHCAIGTSWGEPRRIFEVTVDGTRRLAQQALELGLQRFVHISTMSVYGDDGVLTGVLDETTRVRPAPDSIYGKSKAAAERAVLDLADKGLSAVVFRPARVFGPFSRIFITRPIPAIAEDRFEWLGSPDVASDMVYVDNLVHALLLALFADSDRVSGEVFNISDGDSSTWREFYQYFADALDCDLSRVPICEVARNGSQSAVGRAFQWPASFVRGIGEIVTSPEFKTLGSRVLYTDPVGTLPRRTIDRFPVLERSLRKMVRADDSLPVYQPEEPRSEDVVQMGSGGAVLCIDKLREVLGFDAPTSRQDALDVTLDWVRHARLV